ncbi:hypothetical protein FQN60_011493 [Etheostoma spectabile]|uniref:Uncharacterized protein n=1 Tax=Etheostoma spectabile TaxID=54343 RepID=A0A5J5CE77_9PERO|nr:hypothetical protein FQN60_011493 [Etheostoma spectabile]
MMKMMTQSYHHHHPPPTGLQLAGPICLRVITASQTRKKA